MAPRVDHELLPTEVVKATARRHWIVLFHAPVKRMLISLIIVTFLVLILFFGTWPLRLFSLMLLGGAGWLRWKTWRLDELSVTNRRVLRRYGFFTTRRAHISLRRVSDITISQTVTGKLMNYHAISIESASEHPALSQLTYISNAGKFIDELRLEVYGDEEDRLPGQRRTDPLPHLRRDSF